MLLTPTPILDPDITIVEEPTEVLNKSVSVVIELPSCILSDESNVNWAESGTLSVGLAAAALGGALYLGAKN